MNDLMDRVRQLAHMPARWHSALLYLTPEGEYRVSDNGITGDPAARWVISRDQLGELMWQNDLRRDDLDIPERLARLTALVRERAV